MQKEIRELKQTVQKAEYALKFHDSSSYKEVKESLKNCREVTKSVTTFLKFVDEKYCLELVVLCNNAESEREQIKYIKQYGTEYGEYYKVLSKSVTIGNALSSLIDVKYKQRYIDVQQLKDLMGKIHERIKNNFPDKDFLLEDVERFMIFTLNQ